MSTRGHEGLFVSVGAGLTLIVLLVLQSFLGSGLLSTRTVTVTTSTVTTVTTSDAYEQVANAYTNHLTQLSARNIDAVVSGYESNATIEWTGAIGEGGTGNYTGLANIRILLGSFTGKFNSNFSLSNVYQAIGVKTNARVVVSSTFNFQGYNAVIGNVNGTIVAQDEFAQDGGGAWLIAHETWNFTKYNEQYYIR